MKKILWITPKWPLPANDGQRIATLNLIRNVALLTQIDLLSFTNEEDIVDISLLQKTIKLNQIHHVSTQRKIGFYECYLSLMAVINPKFSIPMILSRFLKRKAEADDWLKKNGPWDTIIFDTLHTSSIFIKNNQLVLENAKYFYRSHNVESDLWEMSAKKTKNPFLKLFFSTQARSMRNFETSLLKQCTKTFTVSQDDLVKLKNLSPTSILEVMPIGMDFSANIKEMEKLNLIFIGRLDWPPNKDGLSWFLEEVWGKAQNQFPHLHLTIAGSGDSSWIQKFLHLPNINFLGRIENINDFYNQSTISIIPIFYGSGTRVKAIEAGRFGRSSISTKLGVQGLNLIDKKNYLNAETAKEWIEILTKLSIEDCKKLGAEAHNHFKKSFDEKEIAKNFIQSLS